MHELMWRISGDWIRIYPDLRQGSEGTVGFHSCPGSLRPDLQVGSKGRAPR